MVVSVMGMFLRTSTGLAVAQKVYSAACWVATAESNALNISYRTFLALTGVGIAVIVAAAAAMTLCQQHDTATAACRPLTRQQPRRQHIRAVSRGRGNQLLHLILAAAVLRIRLSIGGEWNNEC
jgi:hypothetical protein